METFLAVWWVTLMALTVIGVGSFVAVLVKMAVDEWLE